MDTKVWESAFERIKRGLAGFIVKVFSVGILFLLFIGCNSPNAPECVCEENVKAFEWDVERWTKKGILCQDSIVQGTSYWLIGTPDGSDLESMRAFVRINSNYDWVEPTYNVQSTGEVLIQNQPWIEGGDLSNYEYIILIQTYNIGS